MRPTIASLSLRALAVAILAAATGCSSLPGPVADAENLALSLTDYRTDKTLSLVNDTNPDFQDLYSQPRKDASIKLAPMDMMQSLVEFADDHRFFEYARELAPGEAPERTNAIGAITLTADARNYLFLLQYGEGRVDKGKVQAFTDVQKKIAEEYNHVSSLQFISTSNTDGNYFDNEKKRIEQQNQNRKKGKANE
jgi:hypothetical protein